MTTEGIIDPRWRYTMQAKPSVQELELAKACIEGWPSPEKDIAEDMIAGLWVNEVIKKYKVAVNRVSGICRIIGWRPCWRTSRRELGRVTRHQKVTIRDEEILRLYTEERMSLQKVGDICGGVTRERIRQILLRAGHDPDGFRILKAEELANSHQQQRQDYLRRKNEAHETHYALWRKLWAEGKTGREMASILGLKPAAVLVGVSRLRAIHPDWFSYRRPAV